MPHLRERYLEILIKKALKLSSIVGVLGHRQVGKSTLLQTLASSYESLDDADVFEKISSHPKAYLASSRGSPLALDECQLVPGLFPALKEYVRTQKKPGQFLLSGSIRFTSRKAIKESLTGRILNFDLLPFSIAELEGRPLSDLGLKLTSTSEFSEEWLSTQLESDQLAHPAHLEHYLERGGLPGICFIRERLFRQKKIQEQLMTLLDRDLRMVTPTSLSYRQILDYVKQLALLEGQPLRFSSLKRTTGISAVTQKKLIQALEAIFIIRLIPIEGEAKNYTIFFEDQAESLFLSDGNLSLQQQISALLWRNIRTQWAYRLGPEPRFFQFRTRGGALVPWAIQLDGQRIGFIPYSGTEPSRSALGSASSFLSFYMKSKVVFYSIDKNTSPRFHSSRAIGLPLRVLI